MYHSRSRALIAAEDISLRARLARLLRSANFDVELAGNFERALSLASRQRFTVAIVALSSGVPITGVEELKRQVPALLGLQANCDKRHSYMAETDAVLPPTASDEQLLEQVTELARPTDRLDPPTLSVGNSVVDLEAGRIISANGREVSLTLTETALIRELARHPGNVRSRDQLRQAISGRVSDPFDRSIDMLVARLRNKLEPDPKLPRVIVTVPRSGYKLVTQIHHHPQKASENVERRQLTFASCRIARWPSFSFEWEPEELSEASHQFRMAVSAAIEQWGGTIFSSTADRCIAYFCYPLTTERDAEYAVRAALALLKAIGIVSTQLGKTLDLKIGIATGLIALRAGDPVGEPIAAAAALREAAAPNSILVDTRTRRFLDEHFQLAAVPPCTVPEISEPLPAFRVLAKHDSEGPQLQFLPPRRVLIGRDDDVERMLDLWKRTRSGHGQAVVVCGEPGIGKSHLCDAFLRHIADHPHQLIQYQCSALLRNHPLHAIIAQIKRDSGILDEDASEAKLEKLKSTIFRGRPPKIDEMLLYSDLLSSAGKASAQSSAAAKNTRDRLLRRLTRHVVELSSDLPIVVIVSDPQWADSSTLEYIDKLVSSLKAALVLLLFQCRPEFSPNWRGAGHVTLLSLDRLVREQSLALLSTMPGADELPSEIKEQIVFRSDGVPLFLEEITRSAVESATTSCEVTHERGKKNRIFEVPDTLFGSLTARLDRLGPAKSVAQIAAAIGDEWSYSLLKGIADFPRSQLDSSIQCLLDSQLIYRKRGRPNDGIYVFKHSLVRDAAYGTLSKTRRTKLHISIADALIEQTARGLPVQPEVIAYHCSQAERHQDAQNYWQRAADHAAARSGHKEAIAHLNEALALAAKLPQSPERNEAELSVQTKLGNSLRVIEGWTAESAKAAYMRALQLCTVSTPKGQVFGPIFGLWSWHFVRPMLREALNFAQQMMSIARSTCSPVHEVLARQALGFTYFAQGRFDSANQELQRSVKLCDDQHVSSYLSLSGQDPRVHCRLYRAAALSFLGDSAEASVLCGEALNLAQRAQDPFSEAMARTITLRIHQLGGDARLVSAEADAAVALCEEFGFSHYLAMALMLRGWAKAMTGETDAGISEINSGLQRERATGALLYETYAHGLLADACIKAGRFEQSLGFLHRALQVLNRDYSESFYTAEIYRLMAETRFRLTADPRESAPWLSEALYLARQQKAQCLERRLHATASELYGTGREAQSGSERDIHVSEFASGASKRTLEPPRTERGALK